MQLQPLSDKVVITPIAEQEVTKSGIFLPSTVEKEKPEQGEVVSVGPGKMLENGSRAAMSVKAGDKVVFKKYGPDHIKIDGKEFMIVDESDILAIVA